MRRTSGAGDNDLEAVGLGPETMRFSQATSSAASVSAAWRMVSQSDWLPMMMAMGAVMSSILFGNPET
jgi:tetrahydromethanopterin S-methyltransferase subunit D